MDKIRLYQIINTLLLPYREEGFGEKNGDVLADMRYNFSALQERYNKTKMQRKKQEKAYYESEKKIVCALCHIRTPRRVAALRGDFFPFGVE